jgi:hypothetical protein
MQAYIIHPDSIDVLFRSRWQFCNRGVDGLQMMCSKTRCTANVIRLHLPLGLFSRRNAQRQHPLNLRPVVRIVRQPFCLASA